MTVERATLLFVGCMVLLTVILSVYHSQNWLWVTGILGAHLVQASFTGFCPGVIPTPLIDDRCGPFHRAEGFDPAGVAGNPLPSLADGIDDGVVVGPEAV
jgi:hypothetical protein